MRSSTLRPASLRAPWTRGPPRAPGPRGAAPRRARGSARRRACPSAPPGSPRAAAARAGRRRRLSGVLAAVDRRCPRRRRARSVAAAVAASSAATACATCGMSLPKRGPERAVVRLQLPAAQLLRLRDVAHLLHVQLVEHQAAGSARSPRARAARPPPPPRAAAGAASSCPRCGRCGPAPPRRARPPSPARAPRRVPRGYREVAEVHRRLGAVEVLVDLVGHERRERREQLRDRDAGTRAAWRGRAGSPSQKRRREQAHVPVREVVDERARSRGRRWWCRSRRGARSRDLGGGVQARQDPAVELGRLAARRRARRRSRSRRARRSRRCSRACSRNWRTPSPTRLEREAVAVPRLLRGEVVPAEGVRAVARRAPSQGDTTLPLLFDIFWPVVVEDQAEAEAGLVGRLAPQQRGDRRAASRTSRASGRAPRRCSRRGSAARRCSSFSNGAVPLRERHRARVVPGVDHLGHAAHLAAAVGAGEASTSSM